MDEPAGTGCSVVPTVAGDEFERLFQDLWAPLVRLAFLLVDDGGVAQELVQEAFVRAFRSRGQIRDTDAIAPYLRSIVLNLARSWLRRRRVVRRSPSPRGLAALTPEEQSVIREDHREVIAALRGLSARQRECVVLRYYLDLSEADIAATLGISIGSVKSHSHRALAALTTRLEALQ